MRAYAAVLLLIVAGVASASSTTYRAGTKVLSIGDPVSRVIDGMGQPTRIEVLTNEYGRKIGELWIYDLGSKIVKFQVGGGQVEWIEESR